MQLSNILTVSLTVLGAIAAPFAETSTGSTATSTDAEVITIVLPFPSAETCTETTTISTDAEAVTLVLPFTSTVTNYVDPTSGSLTPMPIPTSAYTVMSNCSGGPINFKYISAIAQSFQLGGAPATYCPLTNQTQCPPGDVTAFLGLGALDTLVPGGQLVYVAPDGHLGFTQAHSTDYPAGSVLSPFTFSEQVGGSYTLLGTSAFGATGFMACPIDDQWQVFAAFQGASVPSQNVTDCLEFSPIVGEYTKGIAAWEYT